MCFCRSWSVACYHLASPFSLLQCPYEIMLTAKEDDVTFCTWPENRVPEHVCMQCKKKKRKKWNHSGSNSEVGCTSVSFQSCSLEAKTDGEFFTNCKSIIWMNCRTLKLFVFWTNDTRDVHPQSIIINGKPNRRSAHESLSNMVLVGLRLLGFATTGPGPDPKWTQ